MVAGVYLITVKPTGDTYVGSASNIAKRWGYYAAAAESKNCLGNMPSGLKKAMLVYSSVEFVFEILEVTEHMKEKESYWIEKLSPTLNKLLPSSYAFACPNEKVKQAWDDEMSLISAWWASKTIHTKQYIKWLHDEDIRIGALNFFLNANKVPPDKLSKPSPRPKTGEECYAKHKGSL